MKYYIFFQSGALLCGKLLGNLSAETCRRFVLLTIGAIGYILVAKLLKNSLCLSVNSSLGLAKTTSTFI